MPSTTTIDDTWYKRPPNVNERISAGGIVARREGNRVLFALVREGGWPQFVLPKGGVEKGETLEQAARREIEEEAGLRDLTLVCKLGVRERLNFNKRRWITQHFFLFRTDQIEGTPTDTKRHYGVWWFDLDELPEFLWPEQKALVETHRDFIKQLVV